MGQRIAEKEIANFQFAAISRWGGVTPPYEQIGSIVVGAVSLSGMASSMRNTSLLISPIVQTTLYLPPFSCTVVRWTRGAVVPAAYLHHGVPGPYRRFVRSMVLAGNLL